MKPAHMTGPFATWCYIICIWCVFLAMASISYREYGDMVTTIFCVLAANGCSRSIYRDRMKPMISLTEYQGIMLVAICTMLKDDDLQITATENGEIFWSDSDPAGSALKELIDIGEECALQMGGQTYNEK